MTIPTNTPTRWEIVLYIRGKRIRRICITARKTRQALILAANDAGDEILGALTEDEADKAWRYDRYLGEISFGNGAASVKFGQTEREIYNR